MKNNKGFTLIELIVVMIIIGILVLLATPRFLNYIKDARVTALQTDVKVLRDGSMLYSINKNKTGEENADDYPVTDVVVTADDLNEGYSGEGMKVSDAIIASANRHLKEDDKVTELEDLGLKQLDKEELTNHIRNTSNDIENYYIATKKVEGEVFYNRVLENSMEEEFVTLEPVPVTE